jgi:hypothetical protein
MAHELHSLVRVRFGFRCGYCGTSEQQSGEELTVDHFQPLSARGDDSLTNLVYACFRCNLFKSDFWPDSETSERRVLHPLRDSGDDHFSIEAETGRFHIAWLHLNRDALVERRREEQHWERQQKYIALLEEIVARQKELITLYEEGLT